MAISGYYWLLVAISGYWWLLVAIVGYWWLLANSLPNGASSCSGILRALIRLLIPDVPSQPQHRGTGAGRVEGHAIRGDRPSRPMWPRSTLACTPHGAGRRTELSGELQLFVPRYHSVLGGWKEGRFLIVFFFRTAGMKKSPFKSNLYLDVVRGRNA